MIVHISTGYIRSDQVRSCYDCLCRVGNISSGYDMLVQVSSSYIRLVLFTSS